MATISFSNSGFSTLQLCDLFEFSEHQFSHEYNRNIKGFLIRLWRRLNEMECVKCLMSSLAHCEC